MEQDDLEGRLLAHRRMLQLIVGALAETTSVLSDNGEYLSPIVGTIASADLTADPALVAAEVQGVRVFRGYAGWGPGQLEG